MNVIATKLIAALGGPTAVGRLFGIRAPSVIGWREKGVPAARMQTLQAWAVTRPNIAAALAEAGISVADEFSEAA